MRRRRRLSGSAMIELVLSLSLLTSLFLGTWQFGYTFFLYAELEQAVRAGARYASVQPYHSATSTPTTQYLNAVQRVVVYGTDLATGTPQTPIVNGLSTSQVAVTVTFNNNVPTAVSVSINGYTAPATAGFVTLNNKPLAWFPYSGLYGPP